MWSRSAAEECSEVGSVGPSVSARVSGHAPGSLRLNSFLDVGFDLSRLSIRKVNLGRICDFCSPVAAFKPSAFWAVGSAEGCAAALVPCKAARDSCSSCETLGYLDSAASVLNDLLKHDLDRSASELTVLDLRSDINGG